MIRLRVRESRPFGHPRQLHPSSLCRDFRTRHSFTDHNQRASCRNRHLVHRQEIDCSRWRSSDGDRDLLSCGKLRRLPPGSVRGSAQRGLRMAPRSARGEFGLARASIGLLFQRQLPIWQSARFHSKDSDPRADSLYFLTVVVRLSRPSLNARTERGSPCQSREVEWPRQAATAARSSADVDYGRSGPMAGREALISDHNTSNDPLTNLIKRDSAQEAASSRTSR